VNDATKTITVEYELPRPPEKVWRALTDAALVSKWLMETDLRPEVGHRFTFRAQPAPGWDGVVHCEVLEVVPNQRLRYSWRGGAKQNSGYGSPLDTVVTWTLTPKGNGTLLRLEHSGFTAQNAFAFDNMSKGWSGHIADRLRQTASQLE
jgi:uncharacterized protein YndB with AHSA1/START domain